MSHYKPYPEYKDSGIAAVGLIPEDWKAERIDWLFSRRREDAVPGSERVTAYIDGRVTGRSNVDQKIKAVIKDEGWQKICAGDLAISGMNAHLGAIGVSDTDGQCSPIYLILKSKGAANPHYMGNLLRHYAATGFISSLVNTIRYNSSDFRADDLKNIWVALPNWNEQKSIIRWLERETTRIDTLITKKTRFIELLREKRHALITHAVTKGLDPDVKMKDSGVEWLGEVPEHWEVKALKYVATPIIGLTYSPDEIVAEGQGTLVLRSSNIQGGKIVLDDNVFVSTKIPGRLRTRVGDIVICSRNGSRDLIGKNGVVDERSEGQTFGAFTTAVRSNFNDYLFLILNSALFKFQSGRFLTTTINQLTTETLKSFELPLPPRSEQISIIKQLRSKTSHIDTLLSKTARSIELLKERRSALITAAVTGQIDLREAA